MPLAVLAPVRALEIRYVQLLARNIAREVLSCTSEFRVQGRTQETHVGHIDQPHFVVGRHDNVAQVQ